jgi:hypothetical protein
MTPNYPKKLETNEQQQQEEKWFLEPPFAVKKLLKSCQKVVVKLAKSSS